MVTGTVAARPMWPFFGLVIVASLPFWVLGALVDYQPLPGLPVSALMTFVPAIAAVALVLHREGGAAARKLLARSFDVRRIPSLAWLAVAALTMPLVIFVSLALSRPPGPWVDAGALAAPLMFAAFFIGALGEELGWSGYATEPLAARWGALAAALIIGLFWAAWHVIPFLQGDRSFDWIFWQCAKSVAARVVMVWLFLNAGRSVFAVAVFHAMSNVSVFGTAGGGALYDPITTAFVLTAMAAAVVFISGPRTLGGARSQPFDQ